MIALLEPPRATPEPNNDRLEELVKTVSASRLNLWNNCRLKFYFRYVLQISKPKTAALFVGSLVHAILQSWSMARWKKEPFDLEKYKAQFDEQWKDQQAKARIDWEGEEDKERAGAWNAIECYFKQTPITQDEKPEAVEVSVEADLEKHGLPKLIGVLDLVREGGRIVDFKTCGQTPHPEMVKHTNLLQLSCYAVLYRECTGHLEGGLEIHSIVKTKTPKIIITELPPMTNQQQTRLFKIIESYQAGIYREDFVPAAGFTCAGCEYLKECRAW
ncbi:MAG: PD-(D/E)XK nuclease family protein [Verrucomicrobiota bacterium]